MAELADHGVVLIRADNPSPLTLTGTNTWFVSGWVIDPGPAIDAHLDAVAAAGDAQGIALTHDHEDHVEGVDGLLQRVGDVPVVSGADGRRRAATAWVRSRSRAPRATPTTTSRSSPAAPRSSATPCSARAACSCRPTLAAYLDGLRAPARARPRRCSARATADPIWDVRGKLDEYIAHRLDREQRLLAALDRGLRSEDELLDAAWADAPAAAAAVRGDVAARAPARSCAPRAARTRPAGLYAGRGVGRPGLLDAPAGDLHRGARAASCRSRPRGRAPCGRCRRSPRTRSSARAVS